MKLGQLITNILNLIAILALSYACYTNSESINNVVAQLRDLNLKLIVLEHHTHD